MNIRIKRIHTDAIVPSYAHIGDSGFDLVALEDVIIEPGETVKVRTGLAFEIPDGYELQIRPRSGVTSKTKLRVALGTVDAPYRGEVSVLVDNVAILRQGIYTAYPLKIDGIFDEPSRTEEYRGGTYIIRKFDRIAQGVIAPVIRASFTEVDELTDTDRGDGAFGSTGVV
jgi:dUTP pyrophosphatase